MKKSTIKRAAALAVAGMMTATALAGCGGSSSSGSSKMIQVQQATQKTVKFTILTLSLSRTRIGRLLLRSTRTKQVLR